MSNYQFAQFIFDTSSGCLTRHQHTNETNDNQLEQAIQLRHKVANLLTYLIEHNDRIISKDELLSELWEHGDYRENSLTQSIRELRTALGDKAKNSTFIKTYPQRGYQWICQLDEKQYTVPELTSEQLEVSASSQNNNIQNDINRKANTNTKTKTNKNENKPVESINNYSGNNKPNKQRFRVTLLTTVLILLAGIMIWFNLNSSTEKQQKNEGQKGILNSTQSLLVLPFVNATGDPSMAWLELGLADMLAVDIQRNVQLQNRQLKNNQLKNNQLQSRQLQNKQLKNSQLPSNITKNKPLQVTPPAIANALLLDAQLQWPTLPVHIRSLLRENKLQAALFASVRLHKEQQVLDFQIIYVNGKTKQGSISYPSLPGAVNSISQQLLYLLQPDHKNHTLTAMKTAKKIPLQLKH